MGTSTRILAVAFVAVVAAFIGSTILVQRESRVIDADASLISRDAAPGIQVISNLRVELREMQTRALRVIESGSPGADVADSRRRLDQLLEQAVGLPTDAHEALLLGKLHSAVRAFDEATERALEQARGGHREEAARTVRGDVWRLADVAGAAANELVLYDVKAAESAAQPGEALQRAQSSLSRVRRIVDGLLEFARAGARPETGARADVRVVAAGLLDELGPFAGQRHAVLRFDDVPDCAVACSPGVLLSLLGNLLRNGLKYLGNAEVREVSLRVRPRRGRVLFEVEDTGPGIPPALGQRIFEPYFRGPNTGAPGIGLGLATVKRLVESHGGTLGVRAGANGGALFWFELDEALPAEPRQQHGQPSALRSA